jgi:outer membrane protein insertion porin family
MPPPRRQRRARAIPRLLIAAATCASGALSPFAKAQDQPQPPQPAPAPSAAPKQVQPELEPFEGRVVRAITFKTPDKPDPNNPTGPPIPGQPLEASAENFARNQLRLREGSPFSAELVSRDIATLNHTGKFKRVEGRAQLLADGTAEIIYTVEPQPLITAVQSVGNRVFTDQEISSGTEVFVGTPVDPTQLNRAARQIEERYRQKGYFNALVSIDQDELNQSGIVLFRIREGEKTKITLVQFKGNLSVSSRELKNAIKTTEAWLFDRGALNRDTLDTDVASLTSYYKDRGYLDISVYRRIIPSADGREAIVEFDVSEGPVYTLRRVQQRMLDEGDAKRFSDDQLLGIMEIRPGDVYSDDRLRRSLDAVREAYNKLGYSDAEVNRIERKLHDTAQVDIELWIRQGRQFRTGLVVIEGNTLTRDDVIRRNITLFPERPLDTTEAKATELRLRNTNLFDNKGVKVTLQPEDPANPGYRDVLVQIQETNTGKFAIGAGINSDSGVVGTISLTQRNFDVTDWPDSWGEFLRGEAFRGGGQTFTLEAYPGTQSNVLALSLAEPALFESNYSGSIGGSYRTRDYDAYTERRFGGSLSLGERFGSRWQATVPFKAEQVELTQINADAPADYFKWEGPDLLASVGLKLLRSSVDNVSFPTKGNRVSVGFNQYFSPTTFTAVEGEYTTYLRLSEDVLGRATTLKLDTSIGYIPQGMNDVPFYERYYLGGNNFRGFAYRGVAPRGPQRNGLPSDDAIGGVFRFFAGAEVRQPLYEDLLSGVAFIDTGTVDETLSFSKYRVSVGVGLRVTVRQISPLPFAFDFGFPLLKEDTDETRMFTFSVDLPFH